eukprot:SAG31_NODE_5367_length_2583_cov_3.060386_1_plen_27_part_10
MPLLDILVFILAKQTGVNRASTMGIG